MADEQTTDLAEENLSAEQERLRVRNISIFLFLAGLATLGAVIADRPGAVMLAWIGGFLFGLVTEFRGRP